MTIENAIRLLAGSFILISLLLATLVNQWWLLLTAIVGFSLFQSGLTGSCPVEIILVKLGVGKNSKKS